MRWFLLGLLAVCSGCAEAPNKRTVTICNGTSCAERDSSTATFDPASAVPNPDPDGRIAALESAARDNPGAAYDLGLRFFRGDGVPQDSYKALQWMRSGAERGDLKAQAAVGRLYFTGLEEMGPDLREAEKWLSSAAARGDRESETLLVEVRQARANNEEYRRRLTEWRYATYYYWAQGWAYRGYWDSSRRIYRIY